MSLNRILQMMEYLTRDKRNLSELKFPLDLDTEGNGSVIRFTVNLPNKSQYLANGEYTEAIDPSTGQPVTTVVQRSGSNSLRTRFDKTYKTTTTQIDLFMPARVQTSYQSDWGQEDLGVVGAATDAAQGISEINDWSGDGGKDSWDVVKNTMIESGINIAANTASLISQLNIKGLKSLWNSTIPNPYMEVLFNGVQNRTFSFSFKMLPRNIQEQEAIKKIIHEFKFHRAPEFKFGDLQSNYWLFPSTFDISFLNRYGENPWLFKISTCALTNLTVDYSPDGPNITHHNGAPMSVEITLEFQELEVLDKQRIKDGF